MDELYQRIIDTYRETGSVKKTAEALGTYPIKVRRVLITEGLWRSKTSDRVTELARQGMSVSDISKELGMSEQNVQAYLPYSRGQYGGGNRSNEAIRSETYRGRKQQAARNQVTRAEEMTAKRESEISGPMILEELMEQLESLQKEEEAIRKKIDSIKWRTPLAMELHLELEMGFLDKEGQKSLKTYGRMQKSISRDFIVPGSMTLHGLHYAIQKAFGWQNSHLHKFFPDEEEFKCMTNGGKISEWRRQVGMYFRFPSDNYEDIYWDDDYDENISFKSWLKSKYCGPYTYGGIGEHYLPSQVEVDEFLKRFPKIQKKTTDQRNWGVYMEGGCEELLERSKIADVLRMPGGEFNWNNWKKLKDLALKRAEKDKTEALREFNDLMERLQILYDGIVENTVMHKEPDEETFSKCILAMLDYQMQLDELTDNYDPEPVPALTVLNYCYDYGDDWNVKITCTNAWYDRGGECEDAYGNKINGSFAVKIKNIAKKEKPVCTAWDGMNMIDDVGGVCGFCHFLECINGDDSVEKTEYSAWARWQGWTGRMSKPENLL